MPATKRSRARELIGEARAAARDVLREGETLSGHLRELADSLRINAERLLRDVRAAHAELNARLDRAEPDRAMPTARTGRAPVAPPAVPRMPDEPDVPEFIPPVPPR